MGSRISEVIEPPTPAVPATPRPRSASPFDPHDHPSEAPKFSLLPTRSVRRPTGRRRRSGTPIRPRAERHARACRPNQRVTTKVNSDTTSTIAARMSDRCMQGHPEPSAPRQRPTTTDACFSRVVRGCPWPVPPMRRQDLLRQRIPGRCSSASPDKPLAAGLGEGGLPLSLAQVFRVSPTSRLTSSVARCCRVIVEQPDRP